ncbi:MAG: hypothetical protein IKO49_06950 [Bacilli bacterium]|nr:hypothetical protein [Bacilli bacterium]
MSKEGFKDFARLHPELARSVLNDKVSWQKLYELYDIYGEDSSVWNSYLNTSSVTANLIKDSGLSDIVSTIKGIDLETVQNSIQNMQKAIGLLQEIGIGKAKNIEKSAYEARPMYKYFED